MSNQLERLIDAAIEELHNFPLKTTDTLLEHNRACCVLSAIKGYWSEAGTTTEQDQLLRRLGLQVNYPNSNNELWEQLGRCSL